MKTRTPKLPPIPEREVQAATIAWLRSQGAIVKRRNTGAMPATYKGKSRFVRFSEPGASDLYGSLPIPDRRHFELEIKRRGERPTLDQVEWLLEWHRHGCVAWWADSLERTQEVFRHVMAGGAIRFLPTRREYPVEAKGVKGHVSGPSGDFELT
jgi:hypothetical protein